MYGFKIRKSEHKDFEAIRSLLIICFGERAEKDTALEEDIAEGRMIIMLHNDKVIATLAVVYDAELNGQKITCACTHPMYRKTGIMHELFMTAIKELKKGDKLYCEALRLHDKKHANLHTVLTHMAFKEIKHDYLSWDTSTCRVAHGFSCALQCRDKCNCTCYEDLWVLR